MRKIHSKRRYCLYVDFLHRFHRDNPARKYTDTRSGSLEETVRKAVRDARDYWRVPYRDQEVHSENRFDPGYVPTYERVFYTPEDGTTIRELLAKDDSLFRGTSVAKRWQHIRVPSVKRSEREWMNFYRTFPRIAVMVATGKERFCDGAKLKYVPLFKKILDEEWPEDLKMWSVEQYEDMIRRGFIPNPTKR